MASVSFSNIEKSFGSTKVIHGISFDIQDGEFMVLVGPSGCGKSTLLRMLAGLEEISGGTIAIDGTTVNDMESKDRDIAMVFQSYALYPHMTVRREHGLLPALRKADAKVTSERVAHAAKILNLDPYLERYPRELSGGQRQRVAMGRAIVRDPKVFLFDEPLSNLDAKLRVQMRGEIKALHQRLKTTTVYVTHDQIEAMTMADRIVVMHDGRIEQIGSPLELYDHPGNLFVAQFIGSPAMNVIEGTLKRDGAAAHVDGAWHALAVARGYRRNRRRGGRLRRPPRAHFVRRSAGAGASRDRRRRADRRGNRVRDPGRRDPADPRDQRATERDARTAGRPRDRPVDGPPVRSDERRRLVADALHRDARRATVHRAPRHRLRERPTCTRNQYGRAAVRCDARIPRDALRSAIDNYVVGLDPRVFRRTRLGPRSYLDRPWLSDGTLLQQRFRSRGIATDRLQGLGDLGLSMGTVGDVLVVLGCERRPPSGSGLVSRRLWRSNGTPGVHLASRFSDCDAEATHCRQVRLRMHPCALLRSVRCIRSNLGIWWKPARSDGNVTASTSISGGAIWLKHRPELLRRDLRSSRRSRAWLFVWNHSDAAPLRRQRRNFAGSRYPVAVAGPRDPSAELAATCRTVHDHTTDAGGLARRDARRHLLREWIPTAFAMRWTIPA